MGGARGWETSPDRNSYITPPSPQCGATFRDMYLQMWGRRVGRPRSGETTPGVGAEATRDINVGDGWRVFGRFEGYGRGDLDFWRVAAAGVMMRKRN